MHNFASKVVSDLQSNQEGKFSNKSSGFNLKNFLPKFNEWKYKLAENGNTIEVLKYCALAQ